MFTISTLKHVYTVVSISTNGRQKASATLLGEMATFSPMIEAVTEELILTKLKLKQSLTKRETLYFLTICKYLHAVLFLTLTVILFIFIVFQAMYQAAHN